MNTTPSERAYKTSVYQRREYKIKHSNIANNRASLLQKATTWILVRQEVHTLGIGTGNASASRTGPGPNIL